MASFVYHAAMSDTKIPRSDRGNIPVTTHRRRRRQVTNVGILDA